MKFVLFASILAVFGAALFLLSMPMTTVVVPAGTAKNDPSAGAVVPANLPSVPEAPIPSSTLPAPVGGKNSPDIPNQPPLSNPPDIVKGIYVTGWTAGSPARIDALIALVKRTELNAMVIDTKDYSGYVSYVTGIPEVAATGAEGEIRISKPNALIKKLHDAGIYVIGRITVFQDPILAKAHPEWALQNKVTGKTWIDNKGLAWMDPAGRAVWDYDIAIAKDALARGFDEINFDYVRFASDGSLGQIVYPFWDEKTPRPTIIADFFKYLREHLAGAKISADIFGLATVDTWDDLGIGQVIESAYKYFDYVSPMVYPSHYAPGTLGYKNPAQYPYEIIKYSMDRALDRLVALNKRLMTNATTNASSTVSSSLSEIPVLSSVLSVKLRPWLQDFNLGATYNASMVQKEIQAAYDALLNVSSTKQGRFDGWLLWSAANTYTEGALSPK